MIQNVDKTIKEQFTFVHIVQINWSPDDSHCFVEGGRRHISEICTHHPRFEWAFSFSNIITNSLLLLMSSASSSSVGRILVQHIINCLWMLWNGIHYFVHVMCRCTCIRARVRITLPTAAGEPLLSSPFLLLCNSFTKKMSLLLLLLFCQYCNIVLFVLNWPTSSSCTQTFQSYGPNSGDWRN